jgi:SSS family solute:Na+ symporter
MAAGVVAAPMIGALYWRYATKNSAWITAFSSIFLCVVAFILSYWKILPYTSIQITLTGLILIGVIYISSSLLEHGIRKLPPFNLDRLLHRGKYEITSEHNKPKDTRSRLSKILGITKEFTLGDKIVYTAILIAMLQGSVTFVIGMCWQWLGETTDAGWRIYWRFTVWYYFIGGTFVTIWMIVGGFKDLFNLFRDLKSAVRDASDDGMVIDHQNAQEAESDS